MKLNDDDLLADFVMRGDERAFAAIVDRYVNLVYAAAKRQLRDEHIAQDVTQAVFLLLSRKARRVRRGALAGWLVNAARLTAKSAARAEARRRRLEENAAMKALPLDCTAPHHRETIDENLDEALSRLGDAERTAVTLQFLQGLSTSAVATRMGITEAAARKRSSRAIEKLRAFFGRHGLMVAPAGLIEQMLRHSQMTAPPQLISAAASMTATPAAAALAQAAMTAMAIKTAIVATATTVVGIAVAAGATMMLVAGSGGNASVAASTPPAVRAYPSATPRPAATPPPPTTRSPNAIKVGVYLSRLTAQAPGQNNSPFGYNSQVRIMRELHNVPDLDLRPVIEPRSDESDADLRRKLQVHFSGEQCISVADANALRQLDVLVLNSKARVPDDALAAIEQAVRRGVGLFVRQGFGDDAPGHTPQIARIVGLREVACARSNPTEIEVEVCGTHPILGSLSGEATKRVRLRANGLYGPRLENTLPLLRVTSMGSMFDCHGNPARGDAGWMFYPLFVSEVGSGRVVVCAFAAYTETPRQLMDATENQFVPRAMRWLARRPIDGTQGN